MFAPALALALVAAGPEVRVPLDVFTERQAHLEALREKVKSHTAARAPVIQETVFSGRSDGRNLRFSLRVVAQFAAPGQKLAVLGSDVVVLSAEEDGQPVALVAEHDRWAWSSERPGRRQLVVELVVPPRGPRGSIEYRFAVAPSPVTRLDVTFDTPDLSPRIASAVSKQVRSTETGTRLEAVLKPTSEIHIVGLHDVRASAGRPAKVYGQTHNLVSLSRESIELFSVIDYTILYAPQKTFRVELPAGYDVVSADGQGAFHHRIEVIDHKPVLVGETAFGMRDHYEISLRLKRTLAVDEARVQMPVLELLDVERDTGFVAIEIPGKLSVEGVEGDGLVPLDVRELPEKIVMSAVSPVVRAFRYADRRSPVWLRVARYPERALATGGVDQLVATSVVTKDGRIMTDARLKLRNVLEQYLALHIDARATVESATIDGRPVKPSRDDSGRVLLPLVRSKRENGQLVPFEAQVVYRFDVEAMSLVGRRELMLPKLDVPVSSLEWNVYVPGGYAATQLDGPVRAQRFAQNAQWHDAGLSIPFIQTAEDAEADALEAASTQGFVTDAGSGAMAVQVRIPKRGQHRVYRRYWVDAGEATSVRFTFVRAPIELLGNLLGVIGIAVALAFAWRLRRRSYLVALALAAASVQAAWWMNVSIAWALVLAALGLGIAARDVRARLAAARDAVIENARGVWGRVGERFAAKRSRFETRREHSLAVAWAGELVSVSWLMCRLFLLCGVGVWLMVRAVELLELLARPI
ncbi:MAG: hypothetical protein RIT81_35450 [Deltaproteobacteria bacterium]